MNKRSLLILALIIPAIAILSGCGIRQKRLLQKISINMTKNEVEEVMGEPDHIKCPMTDVNGNAVDIWEYSLATLNHDQLDRNCSLSCISLGATGLGLFAGMPLVLLPVTLCVPGLFSRSPWEYETYLLKFVNNLLTKWGKASDYDEKELKVCLLWN